MTRQVKQHTVFVVVCALMCLSSCETEVYVHPEPITLSLKPFFNSASCGDANQYDTSCLAAVRLVARFGDSDDQQRQIRCTALDETIATLEDFVFSESPNVVMGMLAEHEQVTFEVYGIHDKWNEDTSAVIDDPCSDSDLPKTWLFFGRSDLVDFKSLTESEKTYVEIEVKIDCRDCERGCATLNERAEGSNILICPNNPTSYCVPTTNGWNGSLCAGQPCSSESECFEGALQCDTDGFCDPATYNEGEFCALCNETQSCDPGFACVRPSGSQDGICARKCPLDQWCPSATSCRRLGNNLLLVSSEPEDEAPQTDGGTASVLPDSNDDIPIPPE